MPLPQRIFRKFIVIIKRNISIFAVYPLPGPYGRRTGKRNLFAHAKAYGEFLCNCLTCGTTISCAETKCISGSLKIMWRCFWATRPNLRDERYLQFSACHRGKRRGVPLRLLCDGRLPTRKPHNLQFRRYSKNAVRKSSSSKNPPSSIPNAATVPITASAAAAARATGNPESMDSCRLNYFCESYQLFFSYAGSRLVQLSKRLGARF